MQSRTTGQKVSSRWYIHLYFTSTFSCGKRLTSSSEEVNKHLDARVIKEAKFAQVAAGVFDSSKALKPGLWVRRKPEISLDIQGGDDILETDMMKGSKGSGREKACINIY